MILRINEDAINERIIYFLSFFLYAGYYAGLSLIIAAGLIEQSRYYSVPIRLVTAMFMLILIIVNRNKIVYSNRWIYYLFISFWFLYFIKVLLTANEAKFAMRFSWPEYLLYSFSYSILPFISFSLIEIRKFWNQILDGLIFSGFIMGSISIFLYKDLLLSGVGRISMIAYEDPSLQTLSPLALSYAGSLTIALALFKLIQNPGLYWINKGYLICAILLSFSMFYLGASRGSVIALGLSFFIQLISSKRNVRLRYFAGLLVCIPILIIGSIFVESSVFARTTSISEVTENGDTGSERILIWHEALNQFLLKPFIGDSIELQNVPKETAPYPHNFIIEILMSTGIIGFLLLSPVFIKAIKIVFDKFKGDDIRLFILILFSQGFVQYFFSGSIYGATLLFAPLGMIISMNCKRINFE